MGANMNKSAILHIPQSQYAYPNSENSMTIRLRAAADSLTACILYIGDRACSKSPVQFSPLPMKVVARDELFEYYEAVFEVDFNRICYYFRLESSDEWTYYYADRFLEELPDIILEGSLIEGRSEYYQYPYILRNEIPDVPEWFKNAIVYNIFPDSFATGKEILTVQEKHIQLDNGISSKSLLGGTIRGIIENMGYIKELGFNCIYLNPIFTAGEYHKYDLLDYYHIDPCLGSDEDFKELVEAVHNNGMHIIIDGVFNHCSWYFFAFEDVVKNGEKSKYKDWFYNLSYPVIRPEDSGVPGYACFAYEKKMPKLNTLNKEVQEYFAGVCRYWIREYKVDGWRLDVANEISRDFWRAFRKAAKEENPQAVLIGEVWENAESWLKGDAFDSTMNYDFRKYCREYFAFGKMDASSFAGAVSTMMFRYPANISRGQLNLLDTHDVPRFLSLCRGDIRRWKLAFIFLMLFPGVPSLFYGDEKKIEGITEREYRSAMPWQSSDRDFEEFVKRVLSIRKEYICTVSGYEVLQADKGSGLYSFIRGGDKGRILVCLNAKEGEEMAKVPGRKTVLSEQGVIGREECYVRISAYGFGIYAID